MNLTFLTPRYYPERGGAETWSRAILAAAARSGHRVEVIAGRGPGLAAEEEIDGVRVLRPGPLRGDGLRGRATWYPGFVRAAGELVRASRPDALLAHHSPLPAAVALGRRSGIPAVAMVHDVYGFSGGARARGRLEGSARALVLERSLRALSPDLFLVPSRATAARLGTLTGRRPVVVLPMGADHTLVTSGRVRRDRSRLVYVGRLVREKGVGDLIEAVRMARASGRPLTATIVGDGPEAGALRAQAAPLGDVVDFTGFLDDEETDRCVRRALALVLPSSNEGWGLVITEAAFRGTPYLAYDIPALREQHERLRGGVLTAPTAGALAAAASEMFDDPTKARALAAAGKRAARGLTWDAAWATAEAAITSTLGARGARSG